jgi:glycosyltransferase involved in cell wall biosynthesis
MSKYCYTIFTAIYNSAHTIHRVIESLRHQTFKDFEWIIVNDGSTDNIDDIIEPLIGKEEFPIKYLSQNTNQGRPMAIVRGVSEAQGDFFFNLDADDALYEDALEVFTDVWNSIPLELKPTICGVVGNCVDQHGNFLGTEFPVPDTINGIPVLICDEFESRYKYKVKGEKAGFVKINVMKEFLYDPKIDRHITENVLWFAIATKYKQVYINKVLRTYYIHENPNALTIVAGDINPKGSAFYHEEIINKYMQRMYLSFFKQLKIYIKFIKASLNAKINIFQAIKKLNRPSSRIIALFLIPLAILVKLTKMKDAHNPISS